MHEFHNVYNINGSYSIIETRTKLFTSLLPVVSTIVKFCLFRKKTLGKLVSMLLASTPVGESTVNSNKKNSSGSNAKLSVSKEIVVVSILLPLLINITVELTM